MYLVQLEAPADGVNTTTGGSGDLTTAGQIFDMKSMTFPRFLRPILSAVVVAGTVACTPAVTQRGNLPDAVVLQRIEPGLSTRQDVLAKLGSPSSIATFDDAIWYYIAARSERFAFYKPTVVDQQVVAISFDESGTVASVESYGLDDAKEIEPVDRVTPTGGKKLTILQQLVGNIGRFTNQQGAGGQ